MNIVKIFKNQWIIALLLLSIFLATNGYIYGWDDQHLEIPLLKKLIDPGLYPGDYYIEGLKGNFMSYLYPVLARCISVEQIPAAFFILYLLSRYVLFFFMFKLWQAITRNRGLAILCVLMTLLLGRVEEFLYRTFSHQEFALCFIFAGLYVFYKERYLLAAALLGFAANIHALYSLFPMCYIGVYLLWRKDWRNLLKAGTAFLLLALPFLIWAARRYLTAGHEPAPPREEWLALYQLACPQNFTFYHSSLKYVLTGFQNFINGTGSYWALAALTLLHAKFNTTYQNDKKTQSVILTGWILLACSFIFSYIIPVRFILDLNLIRNEQFMLFFLMGYLIVFLWQTARSQPLKFFACLLLLPFIRFGVYQTLISVLVMIGIHLLPDRWPATPTKRFYAAQSVIVIINGYLFFLLCLSLFQWKTLSLITWITFWGIEAGTLICAALFFRKNINAKTIVTTAAMIAPFVFLTASFSIYHVKRLAIEQTGAGFWQLQRNWIDMQNYVREHTPKSALILVPHDMEMGGFRIRSERSIVMSYRDCGVIGFSYAAAQEWEDRLDRIGDFQVIARNPISTALVNGLMYYKADYIVTMNYVQFRNNPLLKEIYRNEAFRLYQVNR